MQQLKLSERHGINELWFRQETVPGAAFKLNDSVTILAGEHVGQHAAIISLVALEPEPHYLVELGSGAGDVIVRESELESAE